MMPDALTVAIPTRNRPERLLELVTSIVPQLDPDDELLVCDNASETDIHSVLRHLPDVVVRRNAENLGMVGNWNRCLSCATRAWICIIHDDDRIAPHAIRTIKAACRSLNRPGLILHRPEGTDLDSSFRYCLWEPGAWAVLNTQVTPSGAVVHRAVVEDVGVFDPVFEYSSDIEYTARVVARHPVVIVESPEVVLYQLHESNLQNATWQKADFRRQLENIEERVLTYAGVTGAVRNHWREKRLIGYLEYMFANARRINDHAVCRSVAGELFRKKSARRRSRLRALAYLVTRR